MRGARRNRNPLRPAASSGTARRTGFRRPGRGTATRAAPLGRTRRRRDTGRLAPAPRTARTVWHARRARRATRLSRTALGTRPVRHSASLVRHRASPVRTGASPVRAVRGRCPSVRAALVPDVVRLGLPRPRGHRTTSSPPPRPLSPLHRPHPFAHPARTPPLTTRTPPVPRHRSRLHPSPVAPLRRPSSRAPHVPLTQLAGSSRPEPRAHVFRRVTYSASDSRPPAASGSGTARDRWSSARAIRSAAWSWAQSRPPARSTARIVRSRSPSR